MRATGSAIWSECDFFFLRKLQPGTDRRILKKKVWPFTRLPRTLVEKTVLRSGNSNTFFLRFLKG